MTKLEQEKRQTADKDKTTKLRSPLFFINPNRLSIRNLDKAVDETGLKKLIVTSINKGMRRVNEDDCVNLVKARGEDFRVAVGAGGENAARTKPSEERSDELGMRQFRSLFGCASSLNAPHNSNTLATLALAAPPSPRRSAEFRFKEY